MKRLLTAEEKKSELEFLRRLETRVKQSIEMVENGIMVVDDNYGYKAPSDCERLVIGEFVIRECK